LLQKFDSLRNITCVLALGIHHATIAGTG